MSRAGDAGLQETERSDLDLYRLLVDSVVDYAIFLLDTEGHIVSWNPGARRLQGYEAEEVVGRHFSIFYPPEEVAAGRPLYELRVAEDEGRLEDEGWRVRKDGTRFRALGAITALRDDEGRLRGFALVTRDLTERWLAEQALRASEERYRLIVQGVSDYAIFMLDLHGRVASWNDGAARLLGYAPENILGAHHSRFFLPQDVQANVPERALQRAEAESRVEDEGWRVRRDGTRFWASSLVTALRGRDGDLVGYSHIVRDLTERKATEERLARIHEELESRVAARTRELALANRDLEAFTSSVSHDLRAPIRAIEHLSRAIVEDHGSALPSDARDFVERIHESSRRMAELVEALLGLSRLARGEIVRRRVDVTALARDVAAGLQASEPNRKVDVEVADDLQADADPRLLRVVLENLLGNAWKFTRPVEKPRVQVGAETRDGERAFFVRDNGVGFDASRADDLFMPFKRFHPASRFEGTGIGLATVRRVVERHGGRSWADSRPHRGATFWFTLAPPPDA